MTGSVVFGVVCVCVVVPRFGVLSCLLRLFELIFGSKKMEKSIVQSRPGVTTTCQKYRTLLSLQRRDIFIYTTSEIKLECVTVFQGFRDRVMFFFLECLFIYSSFVYRSMILL